MSFLFRFSRIAFKNLENITLVVQLYVGMFELVNRLEVFSILAKINGY